MAAEITGGGVHQFAHRLPGEQPPVIPGRGRVLVGPDLIQRIGVPVAFAPGADPVPAGVEVDDLPPDPGVLLPDHGPPVAHGRSSISAMYRSRLPGRNGPLQPPAF